jgi:hypothetical protein
VSLVLTTARHLLQSEAVRRRLGEAIEVQLQRRQQRADGGDRPAQSESSIDLRDVMSRLVGNHAPGPDVKREQAEARGQQVLAADLAREADEASRRLDELERTANQTVERTRAEVAELKADVAATQRELSERARTEAMAKVEESRRRTEELAERANAHIAEVERQAELTARRLVAEGEAKLARVESQAAAALEQARIDAHAARVKAEAATTQALNATNRARAMARQQAALARRPSGSTSRRRNGSSAGVARHPRTPRQRPSRDRSLKSLSDVELYLLAKARGVEGRADLSRRELLAILEETP